MADVRGKVIVSMLALGAFRIGTLCKLRYRHVRHDLERDATPVHVHVEAEITKGRYHDIQMKGVEFLRGIHAASGLSIAQKTTPNRIQNLKEIVRSFGLDPEEILTREALEKPHRTVIGTSIETSHMDTLLKALKHKLKEELTAETSTQLKTVQVTA